VGSQTFHTPLKKMFVFLASNCGLETLMTYWGLTIEYRLVHYFPDPAVNGPGSEGINLSVATRSELCHIC
jgi:hypothetical protein